MPTYEYVCTSCANQWEEIQKISDSPVETCPKCANSTAKRQISGGNFILKGGGWYADLYSSSPKKTESKSEGASSSKSDTSAASSSTSSTTSSSESSGSTSSASTAPSSK